MEGMVQPTAGWGLGFSQGRVDADGFRIRYWEAGRGSPVVMLHGLGGLVFSGLHAALAKKYRVIALEMPGFGQSAPNDRSRSVPDLAQTVSQAVANLGVDRYSLVGSSFGGRVALWLALQSASAVDLLALLSPTAVLPEGYTPLASASEPSARRGPGGSPAGTTRPAL
jgi:pimeloyl-ACP methyl ester carboxylesterase